MAGVKYGVAAHILEKESRAVFTHCYGHSLNLACNDTIKKSKLMKDALDTTHEVTKLVKKSPARDVIFCQLKDDLCSDCPGIRVLCPTRWRVRAEALQSILDNYMVLHDLWAESVKRVHNTERKARVQGVAAQMMKFDFFFGMSLGQLILRHSDNLSQVEEYYRPIYYEALDLITNCIRQRFKQPGYKTCSELKALILNAGSGELYAREMKSVLDFYGSDFDPLLLPTYLEIFHRNFPTGDVSLTAILEFFRNSSVLDLMSQVTVLVKLMLVMPATNASSDRAFSSVRHIKSYLRSTMLQQCLNHLLLLHIRKECNDQLSLVAVANDFITSSEHCQQVFGMKFLSSDLAP